MSPPGRPKGEYRSAQHEGSTAIPPGRPKGEYRSAQHEGSTVDSTAVELARRHQQLRLRSGLLRRQVLEQSQALHPAWALADSLQDGWHWLRAHPGVVAAAALALVVWRPRRVFGLAWRAWSVWRLVQRWRSTVAKSGPRWF